MYAYWRNVSYFSTLSRLDTSEKTWSGNNASSIDILDEMPKELREALKIIGIVGEDLLPAQSELLNRVYSASEGSKGIHNTFITSPAYGGKTTALVGVAANAAYHGDLAIRRQETLAMKHSTPSAALPRNSNLWSFSWFRISPSPTT